MYTNQMRFTGLSGIDTDSMVKQLMSAEGMKYNKLQQQNQLLLWKQESYRSQASVMSTFQSSVLSLTSTSSSLRLEGNFLNMSSSVKAGGNDTNVITARASSDAAAGTYNLKVEQIAKKDTYESTSAIATQITGSLPVSPYTLSSSDKFSLTLDGVTKSISFSQAEIDDIQAAFTSDMTPISADERAEKLMNAMQEKLNKAFGTDDRFDTKNKVTIGLSELSNGSKTFSFTANNGHSLTINEGYNEAFGFATEDNLSTSFSISKSIEDVFGKTAGVLSSDGKVSFAINGIDFSFDKSDSLDKVMKTVNSSDAGVNLSFNSLNGGFKLEAKETGSANRIEFSDKSGNLLIDGFKFGTRETEGSETILKLNNPIKAQDAVFTFDGTRTTRSSNSFSLSEYGLNITLTEAAEKEENITINVTKDTSKAFDLIKNFVTEYNKMIDSLNKETSISRPKNGRYDYYDPLTDEQKEAMNESDIEKWEEKAKTGLLKGDQLLRSVTQEMRTMLYKRVGLEDGSSIALYDIGITTTNKISEGGKLTLDEDVLKKALEERGEDIATLFTKRSDVTYADNANKSKRMNEQGIADRLNDIIESTVGSNGKLSNKAGIVGTRTATDNDMLDQITKMETRISSMLDYLANKETYYYSMFSKMEAAMTQANSQMASLQSMLGM